MIYNTISYLILPSSSPRTRSGRNGINPGNNIELSGAVAFHFLHGISIVHDIDSHGVASKRGDGSAVDITGDAVGSSRGDAVGRVSNGDNIFTSNTAESRSRDGEFSISEAHHTAGVSWSGIVADTDGGDLRSEA